MPGEVSVFFKKYRKIHNFSVSIKKKQKFTKWNLLIVYQAHYKVLLIIFFIKMIVKNVNGVLNTRQLNIKHRNLVVQGAMKMIKKDLMKSYRDDLLMHTNFVRVILINLVWCSLVWFNLVWFWRCLSIQIHGWLGKI